MRMNPHLQVTGFKTIKIDANGFSPECHTPLKTINGKQKWIVILDKRYQVGWRQRKRRNTPLSPGIRILMCVFPARGYKRNSKWLLSFQFVSGAGAYHCLLCLQRDAPHRAAKRVLSTRSLVFTGREIRNFRERWGHCLTRAFWMAIELRRF